MFNNFKHERYPIRTTLGFHVTPVRIAIIKKTKRTNGGEDSVKRTAGRSIN
jgi:hypothetical protein